MINKKFFKDLKGEYEVFNKERKIIIARSNDALQMSKQAIFAFHRDDLKEGSRLLKSVEKIFGDLLKMTGRAGRLKEEGAYKAALEEYVEAKLFGQYIKTGRIKPISEVTVDTDAYIGGICDLTGEMVRRAVLLATKNKKKEVATIKQDIEDIMYELIYMNLIGYLRTKYDQAKNNLRKMEGILYDIKIKGR